jgi:hypothetical protein
MISIGAAAQVTLQVDQSGTWGDHLTLSTLQTVGLRWKYEGAEITNAAWQLSYTTTPSSTSPIVKTVSIGVPTGPGVYLPFSIPGSMLPDDMPSTFYLRVRTLNGTSSWVKVFVGERASVTSTGSTLAGMLEPKRASTSTSPNPSAGLHLPTPGNSPLATAGAANLLFTPLWIKLTKITCEETTSDGSPSDEVYAIVTTVVRDKLDPARSRSSTRFTNVYENFDAGDSRVPNLGVWGTGGDNDPQPLTDWDDVFIIISLMERDTGKSMGAAALVVNAQMLKIIHDNPTASRATLAEKMMFKYYPYPLMTGGESFLIVGDDGIGHHAMLELTAAELDAARRGTVIEKSFKFRESDVIPGANGKYEVRVKIGKEGQ